MSLFLFLAGIAVSLKAEKVWEQEGLHGKGFLGRRHPPRPWDGSNQDLPYESLTQLWPPTLLPMQPKGAA